MRLFIITVIILVFNFLIFAQPSWKRTTQPKIVDLELFHTTQTANFPTTESLQKGNMMYEISHRFLPSIKDGYDELYGLDGPARIRFALGYGITDHLMITLGRSNNTDNLDLQLKQKLFQFYSKEFPIVVSVLGGISWNTEIPPGINRGRTDSDNFQYYAQLIFNAMLFDKKLGIGLVPSYLQNSFIYAIEKQHTFTFGTYIQYYFNRIWSLWVEYNPIISGYRGRIRLDETGRSYNSLAIGIDIETGGHIFHLMVTNNARLNPSQYLVGADRSVSDDLWRLGFGVLRYF
ncbi:MAG: hypothetical protein IIC75_07400 [Bacteroidetes bacterium]|nr:hypothetical protein [Bacteroidota bacterium]